MNCLIRNSSIQTMRTLQRRITTRADDIEQFYKKRRNRNWLLFAGLLAGGFGIYGYCISRVKQDTFSDVDAAGNLREKV